MITGQHGKHTPAVIPPGSIHPIKEGNRVELHHSLQGLDLKPDMRIAFLKRAIRIVS